MPEERWRMRTQWAVYAAIVAVALVLAMVPGVESYYAWFFGDLYPALIVLVCGSDRRRLLGGPETSRRV